MTGTCQRASVQGSRADSQLEQLRPQLVLLGRVSERAAPGLEVLLGLRHKGPDEDQQSGAAATQAKHIVLLLLPGLGHGQPGHLAQQGGESHAYRGRLPPPQAQQHWGGLFHGSR